MNDTDMFQGTQYYLYTARDLLNLICDVPFHSCGYGAVIEYDAYSMQFLAKHLEIY